MPEQEPTPVRFGLPAPTAALRLAEAVAMRRAASRFSEIRLAAPGRAPYAARRNVETRPSVAEPRAARRCAAYRRAVSSRSVCHRRERLVRGDRWIRRCPRLPASENRCHRGSPCRSSGSRCPHRERDDPDRPCAARGPLRPPDPGARRVRASGTQAACYRVPAPSSIRSRRRRPSRPPARGASVRAAA